MVELIIIGSGITGLLVKEKIPDSVIYEKEKRIEKLNSMASLWTIIPPLCGQFINAVSYTHLTLPTNREV